MKKSIKEKLKEGMSLAGWIVAALVLGIIVGLLFNGSPEITEKYIKPFGTIFLNLVKYFVVPIVIFSVMSGVIAIKDIKKVGSIGLKTVVFFLFTTALAVTIGLVVSNLLKGTFPILETSSLSYEAPESGSFMDTIVGIFPSNFIKPMSDSNMLQIIVGSIIISFAIICCGEKAKPVENLVISLNEVFMKCMDLILKLSPIGVFCLICPVVAANGAKILGSLAMVLLTAYICYALQIIAVYSVSVKTLGNTSPVKFFKALFPAMAFAFSSASSVGTLPINMDGCKKLGVPKDITSFVLPLGATINMDGTAIYQGVCAIFIAACYGFNLTAAQMVTIVLTATLASIGTAGVPGAGMVMLAMVLTSVGLPIDGIALVAGVDRIFDMGRTTVNITGDAACAVVVANLEKKK